MRRSWRPDSWRIGEARRYFICVLDLMLLEVLLGRGGGGGKSISSSLMGIRLSG